MWFGCSGHIYGAIYFKNGEVVGVFFLIMFLLSFLRHGRNAGSSFAAAAWAVTPMFWSTTRTTTPRSPSASSTCTAASRWMPVWPSRGRSSRTASCSTSRPQTARSISSPRLRRRWTSGSAPSASCVGSTSLTTTTVGNAHLLLGSSQVQCFWFISFWDSYTNALILNLDLKKCIFIWEIMFHAKEITELFIAEIIFTTFKAKLLIIRGDFMSVFLCFIIWIRAIDNLKMNFMLNSFK